MVSHDRRTWIALTRMIRTRMTHIEFFSTRCRHRLTRITPFRASGFRLAVVQLAVTTILMSIIAPLAMTRCGAKESSPDSTVADSTVADRQTNTAVERSHPLLRSYPELCEEIAQVRREYTKWGLQRQTSTYELMADGDADDRPGLVDWSKQSPVEQTANRFLRSNEKFRADCLQPTVYKLSVAFDGLLARTRSPRKVVNGPVGKVGGMYEGSAAPPLPHTAFYDFFYAPDLEWFFEQPGGPRFMRWTDVIDIQSVEKVSYNDHPCWKVNWRAIHNDDAETITTCELFIARDRSLIPLRQVYRTLINPVTVKTVTVETDEFQQPETTGLWFPLNATAVRRIGSDLEVSKIDFSIDTCYEQDAIFSDVAPITATHSKPPKPIVTSYAPAPILNMIPGPGDDAISVTHAFRRKTAGMGAISVILLLAAISLCLKFTRLGRVTRDFWAKHPNLLGATGIVLTVGIGAFAIYPPGWLTYGLTMMIAGLAGLGWIMFSFVLLGDRQVSIRVVLAAAACAAIMLGGYNRGIKRMKVRQRMISEVREDGGQVKMGIWRLDEDGLFLPTPLRRLLGEAWSGRANQAAIANDLFTSANVENWCLGEVKWLGITSSSNQPFEVDDRAIASIKDTQALWTLHVEGGYLGAGAFRQLSRFNRLIDVYFDCQHRPVPTEIGLIADLERVWLTNAVVNDDLIASLRGIKNLEYVTLITPRFGDFQQSDLDLPLVGVEVQHANLTPQAMNTLGKFATDLLFVDCILKAGPSAEIALAQTTGVSFRNSHVSDAALPRLVQAPKLRWITLDETDVSDSGLEAFSALRPDVFVSLEQAN